MNDQKLIHMRQNNETTRRGFLSGLNPVRNFRELQDGIESLEVLGAPSARVTTGDQMARDHIRGVTRRAALTLSAEALALAGLVYAGIRAGAIGLKELSGEVTEEDIQDFLSMRWNYTPEEGEVDYKKRPKKVDAINMILEKYQTKIREAPPIPPYASNDLLRTANKIEKLNSTYLWRGALHAALSADSKNADLESVCYSPLGDEANLQFSDGILAPYYHTSNQRVIVPIADFIPNVWASVMMFSAVQVGRVYEEFEEKKLDPEVVMSQAHRSAYELMQVATGGRLEAVLGSVAFRLEKSSGKSKDAFFADVDNELAKAQQHFAPGFDCECMKHTNPAYMLEIKRILAVWLACTSDQKLESLLREYIANLDERITAERRKSADADK